MADSVDRPAMSTMERLRSAGRSVRRCAASLVDRAKMFSRKLRVDHRLKYSNKNILEDLALMGECSEDGPHVYPSAHELAKLSRLAYERDEDEALLGLLDDGWALLTTAKSKQWLNGYSGLAVVNASKRHIVVIHRGTKLCNLGCLSADLSGILCNHFAKQTHSAATFAAEIAGVAARLELERATSFQVFFCGHSLGGWLAQVTAFTAQHLQVEAGEFVARREPGKIFRAVTFESPGCGRMLRKLKDRYLPRCTGRDDVVAQLDIINYLTAPNLINTIDTHVGLVLRLFIYWRSDSTANPGFWCYLRRTHAIEGIIQALDGGGNGRLVRVVDWPKGSEKRSFFKAANPRNQYHVEHQEQSFRYKTTEYDTSAVHLTAFTSKQQDFLKRFQMARDMRKSLDVTPFLPYGLYLAIKDAIPEFASFKMDDHYVTCSSGKMADVFVASVNYMFRVMPNADEVLRVYLTTDAQRISGYVHMNLRRQSNFLVPRTTSI